MSLPWLKKIGWPRFSLRTFLILILLTGCGFGVASRWYRQVYARSQAQRAIVARLTPTTKSWQRPPLYLDYAPEQEMDFVTTFARKWIHPEYQRKFKSALVSGDLVEQSPPLDLRQLFGVEELTFHEYAKPINEKTLVEAFQVSGLKHFQARVATDPDVPGKIDWSVASSALELQSLNLTGNLLRDELAAELGKLPRLRFVNGSGFTLKGLSLLAKAPQLRELHLHLRLPEEKSSLPLDSPLLAGERQAMEQFFDQLATNPHLTELSLHGPFLASPESLAKFCENSKIVKLHLSVTHLDPKCLAQFAKLPNLEIITIRAQGISPDDFTRLAPAKKLEWLLIGNRFSYQDIWRLNEKLPNLIIQRAP